jgi:hypothetical protein
MTDYKKQLERLKDILMSYFSDKALGNAFNDFDKGHQKCAKDFSKDMMKLVDMALKGKLPKRD